MSVSDFTTAATTEQIGATAAALESNGFAVHIVADGDLARKAVLDLIPKGSEVFTSTSVTLDTIGLSEALNGPDYDSVRNRMMPLYGQPDKKKEMKQLAGAADFMVASVHAITADGKLMIASASGSQLGLDVYGADSVIFVVGAQKLVKDLAAGIERIEQHCVPLEDARALAAYGIHTVFAKLLVINKEQPGRVTVVLVEQQIGY